jgi:hypothetical protein
VRREPSLTVHGALRILGHYESPTISTVAESRAAAIPVCGVRAVLSLSLSLSRSAGPQVLVSTLCETFK